MTDVTWNPAGDDDTSFGPLTAHNVLGGRTAADAHPAAAVSYDNDVSGLTGDTVQEAIDELATSGGAVASVNGETGVVVLDAGDVGAVPTARTITAGTGLTGGGDLSADRTLTVTYGATAGTAAEGNDARITGAVQSSLVDAAGDLLVGTADNTVGRMATTAFGRARLADADAAAGRTALGLAAIAASGSAADLTAGIVPAARLGAASSGPLTGRLFSSWMAAPGQTADNITSPFTAAGDLICYPQYMWAGTYVFVGNSYYYNIGTATLRFGLYDSTGTNGGPGALVSDFGTISLVAASGAAAKSISISLTLATSGYYWPSILCDAYTSAPKFVGYTNLGVGPMAFVPGANLPGDTNGVSAIKRTGVTTGAMPATWGTPTALAIGAPVIRFFLS